MQFSRSRFGVSYLAVDVDVIPTVGMAGSMS